MTGCCSKKEPKDSHIKQSYGNKWIPFWILKWNFIPEICGISGQGTFSFRVHIEKVLFALTLKLLCCIVDTWYAWDWVHIEKVYIKREKAMAPHSRTLAWEIPDGGAWQASVHGVAKSWTRLSDFTFTFHFHALEKEMATHSSVAA